MKQQFENYTAEDFKVWKTLFERQVKNLKGKASSDYLSTLDELKTVLSPESIPRFKELNKVLEEKYSFFFSRLKINIRFTYTQSQKCVLYLSSERSKRRNKTFRILPPPVVPLDWDFG